MVSYGMVLYSYYGKIWCSNSILYGVVGWDKKCISQNWRRSATTNSKVKSKVAVSQPNATIPCNAIPAHYIAIPYSQYHTSQYHTIPCNAMPYVVYNTLPCNAIPSKRMISDIGHQTSRQVLSKLALNLWHLLLLFVVQKCTSLKCGKTCMNHQIPFPPNNCNQTSLWTKKRASFFARCEV